MNKKTMKILTIIATILLIISMGVSVVYGLTPDELTGEKIDSGELKNFGNRIIGVLQAIGIVLSVIILIILGIKYMMGSAEEKAEYKKTMIPYLVGAVFIFLAPQIAGIVYSFLNNS